MYDKLQINKFLNLFSNDFQNEYYTYKKKGKTKFLLYSNSIFMRWYHSAMIKNSILSPANIISHLNNENNKKSIIMPSIRPTSTKTFKGFEFDFNYYSINKHPILNDIKILTEEAYPYLSVNEDGFPDEDVLKSILEKISIFDPFYVRYLIMIAYKLKILKKSPSIYISVYDVSDKFNEFFNLNKRDMLKKIFNASIDIAVSELKLFIPYDINIFTDKYIRNIPLNICFTDNIMRDIFNIMGFDFDYIFGIDFDHSYELGELEEALWFGTYYLGFALEKWIFKPFSNYLKFMTPLYITKRTLSDEFEIMKNEIIKNKDYEFPSCAYCPANIYLPSNIGCDFFETEYKDPYEEAFKNIKISSLIDIIVKKYKENKEDELDIFCESYTIYEIKIKMKNQKNYWEVLGVKASMSLDSLHNFICRELFINPFNDYSFFSNTIISEFIRYTPKENTKRTSKKTEDTLLSQILSENNKEIVYKVCNTDNPFYNFDDEYLTINIELLEIKDNEKHINYPTIIEKSNYAKKLESSIEF